MNDSPEIEQSLSDLPPKQAAYLLMRSNDIPTKEAAKAVGYKENSAYQLNRKLKKYDLSDNKLVSKANRTIKKLVDGKAFGSIDKVKDSTSLAAAQMIYDRYQPVVKHNMNVNVNQTFVDVKIGSYQDE
jgi:hypothetical protein